MRHANSIFHLRLIDRQGENHIPPFRPRVLDLALLHLTSHTQEQQQLALNFRIRQPTLLHSLHPLCLSLALLGSLQRRVASTRKVTYGGKGGEKEEEEVRGD